MKKLFKLVALIIIIVSVISYIPKFVNSLFPLYFSEQVDAYSEKYGVDKSLMFALIKAESNFKPDAVSIKGAKGLTQVMEETANWCASKIGYDSLNLFDPKTSIEIGTYYLSYLIDMYDGNERTALAAYNAGHGNVDKWLVNNKYSNDGRTLSTIPYNETDKYVNRIMNYRKIYNYFNKK